MKRPVRLKKSEVTDPEEPAMGVCCLARRRKIMRYILLFIVLHVLRVGFVGEEVQTESNGAIKKSDSILGVHGSAETPGRIASSAEGTKSLPAKLSRRFIRVLQTITVEPEKIPDEMEKDKSSVSQFTCDLG